MQYVYLLESIAAPKQRYLDQTRGSELRPDVPRE